MIRRSGQSPEWYTASHAGRYGLALADAEKILLQVEARYLPAHAGAGERSQFRQKLRIEELMLARACALGHAAAWEEFWTRYHARLRQAARGLTREAARAEELADGLFGDLYGLNTREGARISKLDSYMGLGSLEGWLCALLAQAHVNHWRRERRQVSLEACDQLHRLVTQPDQEVKAAAAVARGMVEPALAQALARASAAARLLLCLYFLDGRNLAQIGALLNVHESTVSRRLDRAIADLRRQTRRELVRQGVRPAAAGEAMQVDPRWLRLDVRRSLAVAAMPKESPHGV
jgi:RNA polymerase sigma-70 factor (ECF subfamily)